MSTKKGNLQAPKRDALDWKNLSSMTRHPCMRKWSGSLMFVMAADAASVCATLFRRYSTRLTSPTPSRWTA